MASGTISFDKSSLTSGKGYLLGKIEYSYSQSTSNNTSTITFTVSVKKGHDSTTLTETTNGTFKYELNVNGETITGSKYLEILTTYKEIESFTRTITHNSNGSKTLNITGSVWLSSNSSSAYYNKHSYVNSSSGALTLSTIARASSITSVTSSVTVGNACSVKWTPASSGFAYKLKFASGSVSHTTDYISPGSTSAYTYNYTMSSSKWSAAMPSSSSATCTVTLYTYTSSSSSSSIGTNSKSFTIKLSSSASDPSAYITATGVNLWNGYYVQGHSQCKLTASFAAGTGSSIESCSVSGTGISLSGSGTSLSGTTKVLTKSGTLTYTAAVSDGRGSASDTVSITVQPYSDPTLSFSAKRTSVSGSIKFTYNAACSSINSRNSLSTLKIYQKLSTDSTWPSTAIKTISLSSTSVNSSVTLTGFSETESFDFKASVSDTYGSVTETMAGASTAFRLLNINAEKTGIALGKMSEDDTFDCGLPMKISSTTTTQSDASFNINSSSSATKMFSSSKYTSDQNYVRAQVYVSSTDHPTFARAESGDGSSYTLNGYLQIQEDQIYTDTAFAAQYGRFTSTTDADAFNQNDVALRVGNPSGEHVDFDGDEIQAKSNASTASSLYINNGGGDVYIGNTNYDGDVYVRKTLNAARGRFTSTTDAAGSSQNDVALRVGNASGEHIDFDGNEIQAKDYAGTPGVLALNHGGGQVTCNGFVIPEIQRGSVTITPDSANTPKAATITFPESFSGIPTVMVTPETAHPGDYVTGVGAINTSATGTTIYLTRANKTATIVHWLAVYY